MYCFRFFILNIGYMYICLALLHTVQTIVKLHTRTVAKF